MQPVPAGQDLRYRGPLRSGSRLSGTAARCRSDGRLGPPHWRRQGRQHLCRRYGEYGAFQGADIARVLVWGEEDTLRSYEFKNGKLVTPAATSLYHAPPGMPGGMLSISANGSQAGTGIVWALLPYAGDANQQRGVRAQLLAFDAQNIKNDLWRSSPPDDPFGPDSVGLFAKFVAPTIANGKVFVATYGDHENPPGPVRYFEGQNPALAGSAPKNFYVAVYGLRP